MEDQTVEKIFATGIQVGVIHLAKELGLFDDTIAEREAKKLYGPRLIEEWRIKRWIVAYPTGNQKIKKFYYKRSELETASRMMSIQNIIPASKINQLLEKIKDDKLQKKGRKQAS